MRPVLENLERVVDDLLGVRRYLQHVHGLVETRVRVHVRAETHPDRLHVVDEFLFLEMFRPVERHMLEEVRQATLVVVLEYGTRIDDEPELRPLLGLGVVPNHVAETVLQLPGADGRIDREGLIEIWLLGEGRGSDQPGDHDARKDVAYKHYGLRFVGARVRGYAGAHGSNKRGICGPAPLPSNGRTGQGSITITDAKQPIDHHTHCPLEFPNRGTT